MITGNNDMCTADILMAVHNLVAWQCAWRLIATKPHEGKGRICGFLSFRIAKHQFIL